MDIECPKCGLISPSTASHCDCGYDFVARQMDRSRMPKPGDSSSGVQLWTARATMYAGGGIPIGAVALLVGLTGEEFNLYVTALGLGALVLGAFLLVLVFRRAG